MKYHVEYRLRSRGPKTWDVAAAKGVVFEFDTLVQAAAAAEDLMIAVNRSHGGELFAHLVEALGGEVTSRIIETRAMPSSASREGEKA